MRDTIMPKVQSDTNSDVRRTVFRPIKALFKVKNETSEREYQDPVFMHLNFFCGFIRNNFRIHLDQIIPR